MLPKTIEKVLNVQIEKEGYSSGLYLAMASWAEGEGYTGITKWLYVQADEERLHMLKLIGFVNERGGKAVIPAFKKPPARFKGVEDMFKQVLKHEEFITASINGIVNLCNRGKDFSTLNFMQWYVGEQLQEEKSARAILDRIKILGNANLFMLDGEIMAMRAAASAAEAPIA